MLFASSALVTTTRDTSALSKSLPQLATELQTQIQQHSPAFADATVEVGEVETKSNGTQDGLVITTASCEGLRRCVNGNTYTQGFFLKSDIDLGNGGKTYYSYQGTPVAIQSPETKKVGMGDLIELGHGNITTIDITDKTSPG